MKKPITTAALITAAILAGTLYAVQDPPECEAGEHFMMVVDVHHHADAEAGTEAHCTRVPVVTVCGDPLSLAWTIDDEAKSIPCGSLEDGEVRRVPTEEAYPDTLVGLVGSTEVVLDEDTTLPPIDPHWGVCIGQGCYCAGTAEQCENIPIGGPRDYWKTRLCRLNSNLEVCLKDTL